MSLIFDGFREQIRKEQPIAKQLREFYLDVLGNDYLDPSVEPAIEQVTDLRVMRTKPKGFFYPLKPEKVEEHRSYCLRSMNQKKEETMTICQKMGIAYLGKWIVQRGDRFFVLYYQEKCEPKVLTPDEIAQDQSISELFQMLSDHTGLSSPQLLPDLEDVFS